MGMLYNGHRAGTPLILTAGQQDRRLKSRSRSSGPTCPRRRSVDEVGRKVERAADLPLAIRRAVQTSLMPPTGRVFLSIPSTCSANR